MERETTTRLKDGTEIVRVYRSVELRDKNASLELMGRRHELWSGEYGPDEVDRILAKIAGIPVDQLPAHMSPEPHVDNIGRDKKRDFLNHGRINTAAEWPSSAFGCAMISLRDLCSAQVWPTLLPIEPSIAACSPLGNTLNSPLTFPDNFSECFAFVA